MIFGKRPDFSKMTRAELLAYKERHNKIVAWVKDQNEKWDAKYPKEKESQSETISKRDDDSMVSPFDIYPVHMWGGD